MIDERFIYNEGGVPRPNPALPHEPPEEEPGHLAGEAFTRRVVSYLLGQMSEEEAEQFEDECFAQKNWPAQIMLVEEDLIDAYLHDELTPEQRGLFELNYLTTAARQERVEVAAALLRQVCARDDAAAEPPVVAGGGGSWAERLKAFFGGSGRGLRVAWAVAAAVVVAGGAWLYFSQARSPRAVATLSLTSSVLTRSDGVRAKPIQLPPGTDALRVLMALPERATPAPRYRVELDNEEGETVLLPVERQDARAVTVLIPASRLARGQYALTLLAVGDDGAEGSAYGSYIFTVE